ncbi:MAG: SDR family oxidoreductase [Dehalococcoidia bacterium]|nr:MAG: SDR family oxidoreductase [Dehalococcoidia bacterium]
MEIDLSDRVAVVAGGGRGIGRSSSLILAQAGASVVVVDIEAERANAVATEIGDSGGRAIPVIADVRESRQVESIVQAALGEYGQIDILVNIIGLASWAPALDMSEEVWDADLVLNLKYVWLCSRAVARVMVEQGRKGSIINICSISGMTAAPSHAAYGSAKAGLVGLTRSLAVEWARYYIRVNAIAPGSMKTPRIMDMIKAAPEIEEAQANRVPLGRWGTTEDVAGAVLFLASDLSDYVTGQTIVVDGGFLISQLAMLGG